MKAVGEAGYSPIVESLKPKGKKGKEKGKRNWKWKRKAMGKGQGAELRATHPLGEGEP